MSKKQTNMLTAEQERALLDAYLGNNDISARRRIAEAYLPMALGAAEVFARRGVAPLNDLVEEATRAVNQALDEMKPDSTIALRDMVRLQIKSSLMKRALDEQGIQALGSRQDSVSPVAEPGRPFFLDVGKTLARVHAIVAYAQQDIGQATASRPT